MADLSSRRYVRDMVRRRGLHLSRRRGQNFLVDADRLDDIREAARLGPEDRVLEIGAGFGVLTSLLAEEAGAVVAVESDRGIYEVLQENLGNQPNVQLVLGDALELDLVSLLSECTVPGVPTTRAPKVVANLPYHITTPVIARLLEEVHQRLPLELIVVMVQKEVAERIAAQPGTKAYGSFTVLVQYYAKPRIEDIVPAASFFPVPKVDSAILTLELRSSPAVTVRDAHLFFRIVRAAFAQRRKTLANALSGAGNFDLTKPELVSAITSAGVKPMIRGERLSLAEFARVTEAVQDRLDGAQ